MTEIGDRTILSTPERALEIGKAAEHIVCADLILSGYRAFLSDQGLPYDVLVDVDGRILRIQVKGCCYPKNVNVSGRNERICYSFFVRRIGKDGTKRLTDNQCDLVALVALDIKIVAYLPISKVGQTVQIPPPLSPQNTRSNRGWSTTIDKYTFNKAIGIEHNYEQDVASLEHCPHGHPYTERNKPKNPGKGCRECERIRCREYQRKKRSGLI